jgi:signal transduction histidine kinase
MVADANGYLWLNGSRGLVRLGAISCARPAQRQPVTPRLFDAVDGMPGIALQSGPISTAALADDGLLWLATNQGLAWLDTTRSHVNTMAPSVRIGDVLYGSAPATARRPAPSGRHQPIADRLRGAVAGAPGAQPLPLSPVRRRRRLAGCRQQHARVLHQPRTGQLPVRGGSRQRRRHLEHCTGQPQLPHRPTFMQTVWFKLLCAAAMLALLVMAVRIRSGQLAALFRARLQERHGERERIARDLHDTLLQGSRA